MCPENSFLVSCSVAQIWKPAINKPKVKTGSKHVGTGKSWPPPPSNQDTQNGQDAPPLPRMGVWLQVVLGLSAGIAFALALQFGEYILIGAQSMAVALLILGVGLLIALAMAGSVWRKYPAFAVTFLVVVVLAVVQDVQWWQST